MKQIAIYFIVALFFSSCGGNSNKSGDQENATSNGKTIRDQMTAQQEEAVKEKYLEKGKEIASATQAELLKVVQGAMKKGGPVYAVEYCNIEALELKDSLSNLNNCTIKRLSNKYRNPADKPVTKIEQEQLKSYETLHSEGKSLASSVHIVGDKVEYYQPIMIGSGACLLCHGDPETQIAAKTMNTIRKLYPDDLATGYAMNDFRGVWKITFLH